MQARPLRRAAAAAFGLGPQDAPSIPAALLLHSHSRLWPIGAAGWPACAAGTDDSPARQQTPRRCVQAPKGCTRAFRAGWGGPQALGSQQRGL